jgi:hypothetical protein
MSSHKFTNNLGREVRWGLDLPTGGFFYTEFYTQEELSELSPFSDVVLSEEGITLSQLNEKMLKLYKFYVPVNVVVEDIKDSLLPTPLQFNVSKMFGVDLGKKLQDLEDDLKANWN